MRRRAHRSGVVVALVALPVVVAAMAVSLGVGVTRGFGQARGGLFPLTAAAVSASASVLPTRSPSDPRFPIVTRSSETINGVDAKVYLPLPGSAGRAAERYPIAVLMRDPHVDASQYEQWAHDLGGYGLAVVVPVRAGPSTLRDVQSWAAAIDAGPPGSPRGLIDPARLFAVVDGSAPLGVRAPRALTAAVFVSPVSTVGAAVPALVVCGGADPFVARCKATAASAAASVTVERADRWSVTNQGSGGPRGDAVPSAARELTIAKLAQWTALWLLAQIGDAEARAIYDGAFASPQSGASVQVAPTISH